MGKFIGNLGAFMSEENYDLILDELYGDKQIALSNALVQAREQANLLESKIELLAIYRMNDDIRTKTKKDAKGKDYDVHYVELKSSEIKSLMGRCGGSIYQQIEAAAIMLKQKLYIYRDEDQFKMDSLYGAVEYKKGGSLNIEFNPETEHLFLELKENFTLLKLDIAFKFKTNGGFQLYKLLKSFAFKLPDIDMSLSQEEQGYLIKEYSLSELRLQLGYVNLNQPDIKKEGSKANPDVEKMNNLEKKPKYRRWVDFNARVIEPGVKEINKMSDIYIASVTKVCGAHGKVEGVAIKFQNNKTYYESHMSQESQSDRDVANEQEETVVLSEEELDDFIDEMSNILTYNFKTREKKAIAESANYNIERIKKAQEVLASYEKHHEIDNVYGFIIKAIENGYEPGMKGEKKSSKNGFHNFEQREYDEAYYDELEKVLLKN